MAKLSIVAGATSQSVNVFVQNSSVTTGAGLTGLAYNTSSLIAYYTFTGANATATAITLATLAAVNSAFSSGGFKEIDSTHMPGLYRLDIPNAALAAASGQSSVIMLSGATNMAPVLLEIELTAWNNQDGVHGGLSALPNTAVTTNASLLTSGTGTDQLSVTSGRIDVGKALGTAVTLDANNVLNVSAKYLAGTALTGRDIGASVLLSSGTGTGQVSLSSGKISEVVLCDTVTTYTGNTVQTGDSYARLGAPAGASVSADIAAAKANLVTLIAGVNVSTLDGQTVTAGAGVTFPASVASPTNITAGTITTVTNLTNAATAGDLTATMKTSVTTAATAATPAATSVTGSVGSIASAGIDLLFTRALVESYAGLHAAPTLAQLLFEARAHLCEKSVSSATLTINGLDGATAKETFTLNSATAPTAITRAS